tara:strand:- start:1655 stop:1801 length:147 start_codon:yes stop_codon:yes gene_type:complete
MSRTEAENELFSMWQNGEVPSNFTEEHTDYESAIKELMNTGCFEYVNF